MNVIIPVSEKHIKQYELSIPFIQKNINHDKTIVIAPVQIIDILKQYGYDVLFIDERDNSFNIDYDFIDNYFDKLNCQNRKGWYIQQFLKMAYSNICKDSFYIVWDIDTIPLKKIKLFDDEIPLYNRKSEYNHPYFKTIDKLFKCHIKHPGFSFISEYMIFKNHYMRELITKIGDNFSKKILLNIDINDLNGSGFSEYETYGNYMLLNHPNEIKFNILNTYRMGRILFNGVPTKEEIQKKKLNYDTISFENWG